MPFPILNRNFLCQKPIYDTAKLYVSQDDETTPYQNEAWRLLSTDENLNIWEQCWTLNCCFLKQYVTNKNSVVGTGIAGMLEGNANLRVSMWRGSASCLVCTPLSLLPLCYCTNKECSCLVHRQLKPISGEFKIEAKCVYF